MTKPEILLAHREHLFPAIFHYYREPLVIVRARDQFVWDADGNEYLDFFGGIVTISVGHCNAEEVQVLVPVGVPNVLVLRPHEHQRLAVVVKHGGEDVLTVRQQNLVLGHGSDPIHLTPAPR